MEKKNIEVPCCHVPKPGDVDKKTPNWVFCGIDRARYSGAARCFREDRMEKVVFFYSGPMLSCPEAKGC